MQYGLIGEKLAHSFSPQIHAAIGEYDYELCELSLSEVGDFLARRDFRGINVTIPYKETVIPYLDAIDESARTLGSVNTVVHKNGKLYGYNTDFSGMCALIRHAKITVEGKKAVILGSGGTAKTARGVLTHLGAKEVLTVSRDKKEGCITYEMLYKEHADAEILVNTTPVGMYPRADGMPVDLEPFHHLSGVIDAVYNPLRTRLVLDARSRGIAAEGGLYMLVAQGVLAAEIFLDRHFPAEEIERIYTELLRAKENIVLIGMPGVGKTTLGKALSERLNRPLYDTDSLLSEQIGSIPDFLKKRGEGAFRLEEARAVHSIRDYTASVIATGGGVVLKQENVNNLLQNGRIYFIDRPIDEIAITSDRPLSSTKEALSARYRERLPLYQDAADVVLSGSHTCEELVLAILEDFPI